MIVMATSAANQHEEDVPVEDGLGRDRSNARCVRCTCDAPDGEIGRTIRMDGWSWLGHTERMKRKLLEGKPNARNVEYAVKGRIVDCWL